MIAVAPTLSLLSTGPHHRSGFLSDLVGLALLVCLSTHPANSQEPKAPSLKKDVRSFLLWPGERLDRTVFRLARAAGVPAGVELLVSSDRFPGGTQQWRELTDISLAEVLDWVVASHPGYMWRLDARAIHVMPVKELRGQTWPLDQTLKFRQTSADEGIESLFARIWGDLQINKARNARMRTAWITRGNAPYVRKLRSGDRQLRGLCDEIAEHDNLLWCWSVEDAGQGSLCHTLRFQPANEDVVGPSDTYVRIRKGFRSPDRTSLARFLDVLASESAMSESLTHETGKILLESLDWGLDEQGLIYAISAIQSYVTSWDVVSPPYDRGAYIKTLAELAADRRSDLRVQSEAIRTLGLMGVVEARPVLVEIAAMQPELKTIVDVSLRLISIQSIVDEKTRIHRYAELVAEACEKESLSDCDQQLADWATRFARRPRDPTVSIEDTEKLLRQAYRVSKNDPGKLFAARFLAGLGMRVPD